MPCKEPMRTRKNRVWLYRSCTARFELKLPRTGGAWFKTRTQAESQNSICFGGMRWGAYLRRKERPNSFANRESSSDLIIKQVSKDNDGSDSGLITTPSALRPTEAGLVMIATPTC